MPGAAGAETARVAVPGEEAWAAAALGRERAAVTVVEGTVQAKAEGEEEGTGAEGRM